VLQYGAQVCGVGRADGYFEFLLRPTPVHAAAALRQVSPVGGELTLRVRPLGPAPTLPSNRPAVMTARAVIHDHGRG
jgi:hypothetical protein